MSDAQFRLEALSYPRGSSKEYEGRWWLQGAPDEDGFRSIAIVNRRREYDACEANAKRLALCWNACDGVDTITLTSMGPGALKALVYAKEQTTAMLEASRAQRAALRVALDRIMRIAMMDDKPRECRTKLQQVHAEAKAAIAEGGGK